MSEGLFATARTRRWRESKLRDFNREEINTIEKYGCQILCVAGDEAGSPNFAYTFGLFDTGGLPEIIAVGLPHETAQAFLNDAADRLRAGTILTQNRQKGLLADVECEFRPVDPKWIKRLMLGATWFYQETEFPVLQAIYPDLENRFPEDTDFDLSFAQPLLQTEQPFGQIEDEFWRSQEYVHRVRPSSMRTG